VEVSCPLGLQVAILAVVYVPAVDDFKPKSSKESDRGVVVAHHLRFHDAKILILQVANNRRDEELG
jgi:hypothetical protein